MTHLKLLISASLLFCFLTDYCFAVEHVHGNKLPFGMEGEVLPNFTVLCEYSFPMIQAMVIVRGHQNIQNVRTRVSRPYQLTFMGSCFPLLRNMQSKKSRKDPPRPSAPVDLEVLQERSVPITVNDYVHTLK